jgi:alpha-N-arabinofuranosidase
MIQANPGGGYNVIRYQQVADVVVNDVIGHLDAQPTRLSIQSTKAQKLYTAANDEQTVSFTVAAINLSNEALAALNTGDIQGLYAEKDAQVKAVKVVRKPWVPTEK